jgi:hypothetical protein
MRRTTASILFAVSILTAAGCGYKSSAYYERHPMSVAQLERVWSKPRRIEVLSDEVKRYHYREANTIGESRWFLIEGDRVVDTGF